MPVTRQFSLLIKNLLLLIVGAYRTLGSLHLGGACRFSPSCSEYAVEALHTLPTGYASKLIFKRICKCHPWGTFGVDLVPSHPCGVANERK